MDGEEVNVILDGWWSVFHQSTEYFMIGKLNKPTIAIIDDIWKEHLREMDELKQSVQNAVYEQKDPLLIYKFESFN